MMITSLDAKKASTILIRRMGSLRSNGAKRRSYAHRSVVTVHFPGASLNSDMSVDSDHEVLMRLNKYLSNLLINIDPSYSKLIDKNGTIVVRLKKALCGLNCGMTKSLVIYAQWVLLKMLMIFVYLID